MAGPVVAAAVIMNPGSSLRMLVRDSKCLTEKNREKIYERLISSEEVYIGVSMVDSMTIDLINILQATLRAMGEAVGRLTIPPACALVDGNVSPPLMCRSIPVIGGDMTEPSISAASIVAKVTRDRYMGSMEDCYPGYGFSRHKGYATKDHIEAIHRLGPCRIHRRSFKGVS